MIVFTNRAVIYMLNFNKYFFEHYIFYDLSLHLVRGPPDSGPLTTGWEPLAYWFKPLRNIYITAGKALIKCRPIQNTIVSAAFWLVGPKVRGFESRSSRHVGTMGKSFTRSCLLRFGVKLQYSIRDMCRERL